MFTVIPKKRVVLKVYGRTDPAREIKRKLSDRHLTHVRKPFADPNVSVSPKTFLVE